MTGASPIDAPAAVRGGEELPVERLEAFLREALPELEGELSVAQFPAGFSNLTYALDFGDRRLVLRRPPFGRKPKSGHDMKREHTVLSALAGVFPYAPRPLLLCEDEAILGAPFFVMERLSGIILRRQVPAGVELGPAAARRLCERLVDVQLELHALDVETLGLGGFGKPRGYVERQIAGWSSRYRRARTPDVPDCEALMSWLTDNLPADSPRAALIHNDYKLDNVVLAADDPLEIIGVLDWEMATVGDPLMDLGASLAYWVEPDDPAELRAVASIVTRLPGALDREQVVERYLEASGLSDHLGAAGFDFYTVYGRFRLAAIAQQIYYRFFHGQTRDPRFGALAAGVRALAASARGVIESSRIGS